MLLRNLLFEHLPWTESKRNREKKNAYKLSHAVKNKRPHDLASIKKMIRDPEWLEAFLADWIESYIENDVGFEIDFEEKYGSSPPEEHSGLTPEQREWAIEHYIENHIPKLYREIVPVLESSDGEPCFRAIALPAHIDPTKHDRIGVYWSMKEDMADVYNSPKGDEVYRFEGIVDMRFVDFAETIRNNLLYPYEHEIKFLPNSPIFIKTVSKIWSRRVSNLGEADEAIPINAERRT